jgi:hypothetical protein
MKGQAGSEVLAGEITAPERLVIAPPAADVLGRDEDQIRETLLKEHEGIDHDLFEGRVFRACETASQYGLRAKIKERHEVLSESEVVHCRLEVGVWSIERARPDKGCRLPGQLFDCWAP